MPRKKVTGKLTLDQLDKKFSDELLVKNIWPDCVGTINLYPRAEVTQNPICLRMVILNVLPVAENTP